MGEKFKKSQKYTICPYCNYKGDEVDLTERGYIYELNNSEKVLDCPSCETQSVMKQTIDKK